MGTTSLRQRRERLQDPHRPSAEELVRWKGDPNFMMSLARGVLVLRSFTEDQPGQSITRISQKTGISRAAVRRCLYTLEKLGYVANHGSVFKLRPKALALGYAYVSSTTFAEIAQPVLDRVRDELHESCSMGVLDADEVYYVARSETKRIMSIALRVGSRLPAYCTSMGRAILAHRPAGEIEGYLSRVELAPNTENTITDRGALLAELDRIRRLGYAMVDEELEPGLRSIAVPVFDHTGRVIAAINVGTQAQRVPGEELTARILPVLQAAAAEISAQC
ncbi:MAG TPA: IclR family transcriptional regulator C-terminal domain-containing protein [Gammaproteobacteria bacterium]|nr:IclR family transcriptional regulator C-terminal domain-containing protein [Gammaproteobacteria bacterium]